MAAHPDDEVLGCGGTLARHAQGGDEVHVLILAEGVTSRDAVGDVAARSDLLAALRASAEAAAQTLGVQPPYFANLPDNRLDSLDLLEIVKTVESYASDMNPTIVYTHHGSDLSIDHQVAHRAALTAFRPLPGATWRAIYCFETLSSTEWATPGSSGFQPNHFVDITATLEIKLAALDCYESEMRRFPHPRSSEAVRALARSRGASVGIEACEAFDVIRQVA